MGRVGAYFSDFWFLLGESRSRLPIVLVLIGVASVLDFLGVALVGPLFIVVTRNPGDRGRATDFVASLGTGALPAIGIALVVVVCLRGLAGYRVQKAIVSFSSNHRAILMNRLLRSYLRKPLNFHVARGSSALLNVVLYHTSTFTIMALAAALRAVTDGAVLIILAVFLALTNFTAVLSLAVILSITFWLVHAHVRPRMTNANAEAATQNKLVISTVTQALSGIREIRVLGREEFFETKLGSASRELAAANARINALTVIPRFAVEAALVLFLVALVVSVVGPDGSSSKNLTAVLGVFGAAAVRLIPASTSLITSLNSFRASRPIVKRLVDELRDAEQTLGQPEVEGKAPTRMSFERLDLEDVVFRYSPSDEAVLDHLSLSIEKGQCVGLMGRSGAGKSTLADTILGFFEPQSGRVEINGRALESCSAEWLAEVAYIPQSPLLLDDTLRRNVALESAESAEEEARLWKALEAAQLADLARSLPKGLDTVVGERGARLSGGQRQRVALARALYFDRQFIVLDEATSALDEETEDQVVRTLLGLRGEKTLLVIAHRQSTLIACTHVYRLDRAAEGSRLEVLRRPGQDEAGIAHVEMEALA